MTETNATKKPRQRKPLPAFSGRVRVLQSIGSIGQPEQQTGEVEINGKPYFVQVLESGFSLFGFDARKGQTTHYQLPGDLAACECLDFLTRADQCEDGKCKHQKALSVLIAKGKLPSRPAPVCIPCHSDEEADALADCWDNHAA
jgi:hypothetical protein